MKLWINAGVEVPKTDETVLAIVDGKCGNVTFENCYMLMVYDGEWFCEDWPEMEKIEVLYWMPLPNLPKELCPHGEEQLRPCEVNCELTCSGCLFEERNGNE